MQKIIPILLLLAVVFACQVELPVTGTITALEIDCTEMKITRVISGDRANYNYYLYHSLCREMDWINSITFYHNSTIILKISPVYNGDLRYIHYSDYSIEDLFIDLDYGDIGLTIDRDFIFTRIVVDMMQIS